MTTPETRQIRRHTARAERKAASRKPVPRDAFKHANAKAKQIQDALARCAPLAAQPVSYAITLKAELAAIKPYISRGKGQGGRRPVHVTAAQVKRAAAKRKRVLAERARQR